MLPKRQAIVPMRSPLTFFCARLPCTCCSYRWDACIHRGCCTISSNLRTWLPCKAGWWMPGHRKGDSQGTNRSRGGIPHRCRHACKAWRCYAQYACKDIPSPSASVALAAIASLSTKRCDGRRTLKCFSSNAESILPWLQSDADVCSTRISRGWCTSRRLRRRWISCQSWYRQGGEQWSTSILSVIAILTVSWN